MNMKICKTNADSTLNFMKGKEEIPRDVRNSVRNMSETQQDKKEEI